MKVVYVLTSKGKDFFSAMTRLSAASVRCSCKNFEVWLVCDSVTHKALIETGDQLLNEVDQTIAVDSVYEEAVLRNRDLKTRLRLLVEGNFLFLDSDMLIRSDLTGLFDLNEDLAVTPNHSFLDPKLQIGDQDKNDLDQMGWSPRNDVYANGGFLWYNETPAASDFAEAWHRNWTQSSQKLGRYRDQPSLNHSLNSVPKLELKILPLEFNAQFRANMRSIHGAKVWHYYAAERIGATTGFEALTLGLMQGAPICMDEVQTMIDRPHPWRRDYWWDDWIAGSVQKKSELSVSDRIWLEGRRLESIKYRIRNLLKK